MSKRVQNVDIAMVLFIDWRMLKAKWCVIAMRVRCRGTGIIDIVPSSSYKGVNVVFYKIHQWYCTCTVHYLA